MTGATRRSIWLMILTLLPVFGLENCQFSGPCGSSRHQAMGAFHLQRSQRAYNSIISATKTGTVPMFSTDLAVIAGDQHRKDFLDRDKNTNVTDG